MVFNRHALMLLALVAISSNVDAQTWSERLGYGKDSRVVILTGRECGLSWEMNAACRELLQAKRLTSAEVMVTGPWFDDFADWCRANPNQDIGLSLAFYNPYKTPSWNLLTPTIGHTSLVNADRRPWSSIAQLTGNATADDLQAELDEQLRQARIAGVSVTHLGSFHGTVFCRSDYAAVYLGAAKKYWIPATVVDLTPERIAKFRSQGFPVDETLIAMIDDYPLPKLDDLVRAPWRETYDETVAAYRKMLNELPPGLIQVSLAPAKASEGVDRIDGTGEQRAWHERMLGDSQIAEAMKQNGIQTTTWREIMRRFEGYDPDLSADAGQSDE